MKINISKQDAIQFYHAYTNKQIMEFELNDYIDNLFNKIKSIEDTVDVQRIIFIENKKEINSLALGNHWVDSDFYFTDDFVNYLKYECNGEEILGKPYLLTATFNVSSIDAENTIYQNLHNPSEEEIFIKDMSKPVGVCMIQGFGKNQLPIMPLIDFIKPKSEVNYEHNY